MKKYQNNGHVVVSAPSTSPHYMQSAQQQLAQQPGAGMPSVASNNAHITQHIAPTVTPVPTASAAVTSAAAVSAGAATPHATSNMSAPGSGGPPVVSAQANTNDNLAKAAQQPSDATPTASINPPEAEVVTSGHTAPGVDPRGGPGGQPPSNHQYSSHPQHRGHNQREDNYNTGFSYNPRASMESIQSGKDMQK